MRGVYPFGYEFIVIKFDQGGYFASVVQVFYGSYSIIARVEMNSFCDFAGRGVFFEDIESAVVTQCPA